MRFTLEDHSANDSFASLDLALTNFGSHLFVDILYVSMLISTSLVGVILNSLSLVVFISKKNNEFRIGFYDYMRVYSSCGILLNFSEFFFGFTQCYHLFPELARQFAAQFYTTYIYSPVHNTLTCLKFLIDILIIINRLLSFNSSSNRLCSKFKSLSPYMLSLVILMVLIPLNSPYFIAYALEKKIIKVTNDNNNENDDQLFVYYIIVNSKFALSILGQAVLYALFFLRHVLTLCVEIALNCIFYIQLRRYAIRKSLLTRCKTLRSNQISSASDYIVIDLAKSANTPPMPINRSVLSCVNVSEKNTQRNTRMIVVMSVVSMFHQAVLITYYVYDIQSSDTLRDALRFCSNYISCLRHSLAFFIFYAYNKTFKSSINEMVAKKLPTRCKL